MTPRCAAHGTRRSHEMAFVTLDPAGRPISIRRSRSSGAGDDVVLHYAIADVGWFVRPGDALDTEAWHRGVTVYLPDRRRRCTRPSLSEGAASLLPDVDRPAVVFWSASPRTAVAPRRRGARRRAESGPSWRTRR